MKKSRLSYTIRMKAQSVVKGTFVLMLGGVVGKILGAVYRIPLVHILGAEGMGLYQLIFPMYSLLLTVSSGGIPSAVARLVSSRNAVGQGADGARIARSAQVSLAVIGVVTAGAVALMAGVLARAQGNPQARLGYLAIAPSVAFVAVVSALRGYFQGHLNMTPTSLSQIVEQAVKLVVGLLLSALLVRYGVEWGAFGAALGVSVSELSGMVLLLILRRKVAAPLPVSVRGQFRSDCKAIYALAIPITLGGIVMPITQLIDSAVVVNILKRTYTVAQATALYGIASGTVGSLVNMPVVVTLSLATAMLPSVTASFSTGDMVSVRKKSGMALRVAVALALPCAAVLAIFARPIVDLLYGGGLSVGEINEPLVAANLLALMSACVVLLGLVQVSTALLQAVGKVYAPVVCLSVGAAAKLAVDLIGLPRVGIYAVALSNLACYGIAAILDLVVLASAVKPRFPVWRGVGAPLVATLLTAGVGYGVCRLLTMAMPAKFACIIAIAVGVVAYSLSLLALGAVTKDEREHLPVLGRLTGFRRKARASA